MLQGQSGCAVRRCPGSASPEGEKVQWCLSCLFILPLGGIGEETADGGRALLGLCRFSLSLPTWSSSSAPNASLPCQAPPSDSRAGEEGVRLMTARCGRQLCLWRPRALLLSQFSPFCFPTCTLSKLEREARVCCERGPFCSRRSVSL